MQNRLGFQQNIYSSVIYIAILSLAKQLREVMQGNAVSIGNCAGGKLPVPTGHPRHHRPTWEPASPLGYGQQGNDRTIYDLA